MFFIEQPLARKVQLALFHLNQIATVKGLLVYFATGSLLGWREQRIREALRQTLIYSDVGLTRVVWHERWWLLEILVVEILVVEILVIEILVLIGSWYLIAQVHLVIIELHHVSEAVLLI